MNFSNNLFNPNFVNQDNYQQFINQIEQYNYEQNKEIHNAVKAIHDYCEAMKKLNPQNQQTANVYCAIEILKALNQKNDYL